MAFIDYERTFYSVKSSAVLQVHKRPGIDEPYMKVLEDTYSDSTAIIIPHKRAVMSQLEELLYKVTQSSQNYHIQETRVEPHRG